MKELKPIDSRKEFLWKAAGAVLKVGERINIRIALALIALVLGALGISELIEETLEGDATAFDETILLLFRTGHDLSDPIGSETIEQAVRDFTSLGGIPITGTFTLMAAAFYFIARKPRAALFLLVSVAAGVGIVFAIKYGVGRDRPSLVSHGMTALSPSFPSGHTASASLIYLTLAGLIADELPRLRLKVFVFLAAGFLALAVGLSRIYLGVHWPTDVLGGLAFGGSWAIAVWLIQMDFKDRGWLEPSERWSNRRLAHVPRAAGGSAPTPTE